MGDGPHQKKQLGKILLKQKLVTEDQLNQMLEEQKAHPGQRLASTIRQAGIIKEVDLLKALSEQQGLPGIDLAQVVIPLENCRLIPVDIAKRHLILPILVKEDRIFLAMADPGDRRVIDEIEFVTGRKVFPYVALHDSLREVIEEVYRCAERGEQHYIGPDAPPDYLDSLGLAPATPGPASQPPGPTSQPPEPRPGGAGGVVVDRELGGETDDDLGIVELSSRVPTPSTPLDVPPKPAGRPRVLIVDDEEDIRRMLRRVLSEKGYDVVEASRGLDALHIVRDHAPDVILLDAMLPEIHGFDICRRIKGSKRYGAIPIVMLSAIYRGWRVAEDLRQSYGVGEFLEKPFKIGDVLMAIERSLKGRPKGADDEQDQLSDEAGQSLQQGLDAYRRGDLDTAIETLREGIGIDPLSFQLHYHLGLLCGRKDAVFEGIHALETAVDLQPRNFSALRNLAVLYQRAGFKHKAVEMWERALGNAPDEETRQGIKDHLMSLL